VSLPVVIQDDANIEVEEAALWYEAQRPGYWVARRPS
jgi:hypothetical protein